ncbi:MAG: hypothetical protein KJ620_09110 [Candidatus Edwardsbacteria bacterium]|nr:hypothetical protein [Candidatus Edwardsbacteria bacterium]MBU1576911.1 hypothetical protein [Candidatus Edwardsbacteria bacterium]MBU2463092.1 hypothetical protein [Candidatus Edwardsbacteria bacterium]MBU2594272.1 hypothetical protein [Candidatus Edwardsbacteria bacterium]
MADENNKKGSESETYELDSKIARYAKLYIDYGGQLEKIEESGKNFMKIVLSRIEEIFNADNKLKTKTNIKDYLIFKNYYSFGISIPKGQNTLTIDVSFFDPEDISARPSIEIYLTGKVKNGNNFFSALEKNIGKYKAIKIGQRDRGRYYECAVDFTKDVNTIAEAMYKELSEIFDVIEQIINKLDE